MFVMATAPSDLTVSALNNASGDWLKFWIQGVNDAAGKKVLNKSGRVKDLKTRLATHYGLDRSCPAAAPTGPLPLDKHIQKKQWDHLRGLGAEWAQRASAGREFKLCASSNGVWLKCFSRLLIIIINQPHTLCLSVSGTTSSASCINLPSCLSLTWLS
jgi:hypothetical protein